MTATKPSRKKPRAYANHGVYKLKAGLKRMASGGLDRRRTLDRAVLEWESAVIADLGGPGNLTTLQRGILRALAWDRLFLDSAAVLLAEMSLVNKRDRRFYRVVLERSQLEDSFARRAAMLGLERKAKPVPLLSEYVQRGGDGKDGV